MHYNLWMYYLVPDTTICELINKYYHFKLFNLWCYIINTLKNSTILIFNFNDWSFDLSFKKYVGIGRRSCRSGYFHCQNNRCISVSLQCNNVNDCGDGSDEANCSCVAGTHFQCKAGPCILNRYRCDADPDCPDASDEMGCRKSHTVPF